MTVKVLNSYDWEKIKKEDKEMSHKITVFRGDGIGPELVDNVLKILKAADAPLEYEIFNVGEDEWKRNGALIPEEAYASFERTKSTLKIPDYDSGWKKDSAP